MVAAGTTVLMAAREENSSNETENCRNRTINQSACSRYAKTQRCGQRNIESPIKQDIATSSSDIIEKKRDSFMSEKNSKTIPKGSVKEGSKNLASHKATPVRETKTSRLRAASVLPNSGLTLSSKRAFGSEISGSHKCNLSVKEESTTSFDGSITMNPVKERDKNYKRKSYLNRSRHTEAASVYRSNETESGERRIRRQFIKQAQGSEIISSSTDPHSNQQVDSPCKKYADTKVAVQYNTAKNLSKTYSPSSVVSTPNTKCLNMQQPSDSPGDSEVSRRVDVLTALTQATMERVERLTSATAVNSINHSMEKVHTITEKVSISPRSPRSSKLKHMPVSILKHKTLDGEGCDRQASSSGSHHTLLPVTFSPSVVEPVTHKRHGILKKRSSLDENEILRRRSCSPDVSFADTSYSEFRPILKNQKRRSSLDEIVKRDQSPDQQPASILKRKSSREDDREIHRSFLGSLEPQSILKRKLANNIRNNSVNHHVTIASNIACTHADEYTNVVSNVNTNNSFASESLEGSEVRPILKKKYSKEEFAGNDILFVEPRPILKKKSSTESDEHEHDKPKKTILKSRKNSLGEGNYETELTSPRKQSALKNRAIEMENVRPILKQTSVASCRHDDAHNLPDLFLRKRAQSVSHPQAGNGDNCVESIRLLTKRRSLESSSPTDVLRTQTNTRHNFTTDEYNKISYTTNSSDIIKENKLLFERSWKGEQTNTDNMDERNKIGSHTYLAEANADTINIDAMNISDQTIDKKENIEEKEQKRQHVQEISEDYTAICRSNSVSKMTQHFLSLQEKENTVTTENNPQRSTLRKSSHGMRRYRKAQGNERFNTQPITFEEMREAVLQNQRNAALGIEGTSEDDLEPSKLSLAERVQLFNQRITTMETNMTNSALQEKYPYRRRPSARYKTQPITSEEVEVASRMSHLNINDRIQTTTAGHSKECQRPIQSPTLITTSQHDLPKSILKSSICSSHISRAKSPELQSLKLIKSVLKRESEESENPMISNFEAHLRPILKSSYSKSIQNTSINVDMLRSEKSMYENQNPNSDSEKICEKLIGSNETILCNIQKSIPKENNTIENKTTVPFYKNEIFQREEISDDVDNCDNILNYVSEKCNHKSYNNFLANTMNRVLNDDNGDDNNDGNDGNDKGTNKEKYSKVEQDDDDGHTSLSSSEQEIHNITVSKKDIDTAQYSVKKLAKSVSQHAISDGKQKQLGIPLPGLCRSATQVITSIETSEAPSISIADRLAALRHCGNTNWKRRMAGNNDLCDMTRNHDEENATIKSGALVDCIEKLESATGGWKNRIIAPDAVNFTVAGKMKMAQSKGDPASSIFTEITTNTAYQKKKIPHLLQSKVKENKEYPKGTVSTLTSSCKDISASTCTSFSKPTSDDNGEECKTEHVLSPTVSVPKMDNDTFTSFFSSLSLEKCKTECLNLDESDFDILAPQSELLVQKRRVRTQRRRVISRNPLKALAARTDIKSEYTEIHTDIAAKSMKNLTLEKLTKSSSLAVEALAGLASTEDFSAITLRNVTETNVFTNKLQPYKDIMLILVKGRRHVQARLVEPIAQSINSGDNYILVTKSEVFNYVGQYSNIIERTRAAEIALNIQQHKDLGCQAAQIITINEDKPTCTKSQVQKFWRYLGVLDSDKVTVIEAGHPDEDELYESAIIDTNMVYELKDKQLVPHEKFWCTLPKIEMLDKNKILVFDFGTEMYIWSGKGVSTDEKKLVTQLATEMWNDGYDYTECTVCPINMTRIIGNRNDSRLNSTIKSSKSRPEWCLFAKLTQHVETILFREKFLDWPNIANTTKARNKKNDQQQIDGTVTVYLDNSDDSWMQPNVTPVDLVLEGCHLGRGTGYYHNELKKEYIVVTTSLTVWHIDEFSKTLLNGSSIGQFYSGDSYIIQWIYSVTITGRELSGLPSKHSAKGRDRSVYFIWQGRNTSLNEQGAAALLTVELDNDRVPQIRVIQGYEPAAFLNLFSGKMVVHNGKKTEKQCEKRWRLYICRGTLDSETFLIEIPCSTRHLRSRGSFILLDTKNAKIYIWHGNNSLPHIKENTVKAANKLKENRPEETGLLIDSNIQICEIHEGSEPEDFSDALGGVNKKLYWSLDATEIQDYTPRLYHLSNISKKFLATEILCPHRAHLATAFPFSQDDLYQVNQPALFLLDDKHVIWIWQGWWPDSGTEDQSGSKTLRWQAERRAAMTIAIRYWQNTRDSQKTNMPIYLVWAGLEPLQFINIFPEWTYRDDVAELNIEDGRNPGEVLIAETELARLTQSTYPPAQLLQRPLPDGVDPTRLELYLSQQHFQELLGMSKEEFQQLPIWKQVNLKKEIGLF